MWRSAIVTAAIPMGLLISSMSASATVVMDWTPVGNANNSADTNGKGAVAYNFEISKYEVTNTQYAEFLNAVAASNPNGLYNSNMGSNSLGGITQSGSPGSYTYAVKANMGDKPVVYVSWKDAARFTNWLNNGQGAGSTETGTYDMSVADASIARSVTATVFLPSLDEWYKAAYYDGSSSYYDYATQSNTTPTFSNPPGTGNNVNAFGQSGGYYNVGSYTNTPNHYGTFDQNGNAWEWVETGGANRGTLGGAFGSGAGDLNRSNYANANSLGSEFSSVGFRVAMVPEPASCVALLTLGGLTALRRRRTT